MSTYVLNLKLDTKIFQENILDKRFEIARKIYNCLVLEFYKRYNFMCQSKEYNKIHKQILNNYKKINIKNTLSKKQEYKMQSKQLKKEIKELQNSNKELCKMQNNLYVKYSIDKNSLSRFLTPIKNHYEHNFDIHTCQKILDAMYKSVDKFLYGNGKKVYFKPFEELNSLESKTNACGIKYRNGFIQWNGLNISVIIKEKDNYAQLAIQDKVKYCRIKREMIKGKYHYYVQLVLGGIPPQKINKQTDEVKGQIGQGKVGIDNGISTTAICSEYQVMLVELADKLNNIEREKVLIQRKMDRSRRSMNPNKYNSNGTIKKGNKDKWIKSNKHIKLQNKYKELYRKQSAIRKQCHYELIAKILPLGNEFYVETMNYSGLQKKNKETEKNNKGKFKKKKRFGKNIANKAPSMFLTMLNQKLEYHGLKLNKINTQKVKASQYNHLENKFIKKKLRERWNDFGEFKIQRDLYSAFLIMNVDENLDAINRDLCFNKFDNFKILHDNEINRLKLNNKNLSSMGI